MESPSRSLTLSSPPIHSLSTTTNTFGRSASPEFEFSTIDCGFRTPLHSADELFSDGFLLPLHFLPNPNRPAEPEPGPTEPDHDHVRPGSGSPEPDSGFSEPDPGLTEPDSGAEPEPSALITSSSSSNSILSASKRWREMFKRGDKKTNTSSTNTTSVGGEKTDTNMGTSTSTTTVRSNNKSCNSGNRNSSAELNINIWPFSRSRSAGNNSSRTKPAVQVNRKVSSAPCSRSNSSGESKSRKSWPSSPGRAGVHLGRSSPVWQVRKGGPGNRTAQGHGPGSGKGRALKLNVPVCIGYRQSMGCRSDEGGPEVGPGSGGSGGGSGSNGNMFRLRGLFSKKSSTVLTV